MPSSATLSTTNVYKCIRDLWPQKSIYEAILDQSPTIGLLNKSTDFYEWTRYIDAGYAIPQGVGPTLGIAKQSKTPSKTVEFALRTKPMYGVVSVAGDLIRKSRGDKAMIVKPVGRETKNVIMAMKRDLSRWVHGNGVGSLGQCGTLTTSSQTITLADASQARFFDVGMLISTCATDTSAGTINPGYLTIASVSRGQSTATLTVSEATLATGIPAIATSDYIYRYGFYNNTPITGFEGWNPGTAPTGGDSFFGVDRSVDPQKLSGLRLSYAGQTKKEALMKSASALADFGADPDTCILNTSDWNDLALELQSVGSLTMTQVPATAIGKFNFGLAYDAIKFQGPRKSIAVIADPDAPVGVGRMFMKESVFLASTGEMLAWIEGASPNAPMVEDQADAIEMRIVGDLCLYNEAPYSMARIAF